MQRIFQRQGQFTGLLFLLNRGVSFGVFRKSLLFEGARCMSMGFQRHGSETSGEFVIRYEMAELRETGRGAECGLWKLRNGIGVFHYVG